MIGVGIFILVAAVVVLLSGLRQIGEKERAAVEIFRKFYGVLGPGLKPTLPGIMRIKRVPTHELSIPLFESQVKIDFSDGWAIPKNSEAWVAMKSPDDPYSVDGDQAKSGAYRAIYEIGDWRLAIKDIVENALRTYLNRLSIDEAITMQKAGFDLVNRDPDAGIPNQELIKIEEALAKWGWKLLRITVGDFDVDPALIAARSSVHQARKGAEAGEHKARQEAAETARAVLLMMAEGYGKTPEEMQALIEKEPALQREFSDLVRRKMAFNANSRTEIGVEGAEGPEKFFLNLLTAFKRIPTGPSKREEVSKRESRDEGLPSRSRTKPLDKPTGSRPSKKELDKRSLDHARQLDEERKKKKD